LTASEIQAPVDQEALVSEFLQLPSSILHNSTDQEGTLLKLITLDDEIKCYKADGPFRISGNNLREEEGENNIGVIIQNEGRIKYRNPMIDSNGDVAINVTIGFTAYRVIVPIEVYREKIKQQPIEEKRQETSIEETPTHDVKKQIPAHDVKEQSRTVMEKTTIEEVKNKALKDIKKYYKHYVSDKHGKTREHDYHVQGVGDFNDFKGDYLKSKILEKFKTHLEQKITSIDELTKFKDGLKNDKDYKILAMSQGKTTKLLHLKTDSVKALNEMINDKKTELLQNSKKLNT
jgi:hypothetical protein